MDNRGEWIAQIDRYIHRFAVLYKTRFQHDRGALEQKLTPLEIGILNIMEWEPGASLKEIVEYLNAPNSTVTGAVDRLEKRGIVARSIHPRDKRSFALEFTNLGQKISHHRATAKEHMLGALYKALEDDAARESLRRLLERALDNLSTQKERSAGGVDGEVDLVPKKKER